MSKDKNINNPDSYRSLSVAEKRLLAIQLKAMGYNYLEIGKKLGVSNVTASKYVHKAIEERNAKQADATEDLINIEIERLDSMLKAISQQVSKGHLGAIDKAIKISQERRKLLGLDAPKKLANADGDDLFSGFIEALDQVHNKDDHEKPE